MSDDSQGRVFVLEFDYGDRLGLAEFILDVSRRYDSESLIGFGMAVNNNIYDLQCFIFMNFVRDEDLFEAWVSQAYPKLKLAVNTFISDFLIDMRSRGYSVMTFSEGMDDLISTTISTYGEGLPFLWPGRSEFNAVWQVRNYKDLPHVFICYSSKDQQIVEKLFVEFQKNNVRAWYDKYEIELGDDIAAKINEGLSKAACAIIVLSSNSVNKSAVWPKAEQSFFTTSEITSNFKVICLNLDLRYDQVPPLLRRLRYQKIDEPNALQNVARAVSNLMRIR